MLAHIPMFVALPVTSYEEAKDFYGKTLGMHILDENGHGLWYQCGPSRFLVYESKFVGTNQATAAVWEVADPAGTVESLKKRGIVFERYEDIPGLKRKGDLHVAGSFKVAWFKDPFGNIICIANPL